MVDYNLPLYQHKTEKWDAKKCAKMANYTAKDGMGTKYPFKGYLHPPTIEGQSIRYNGGCIREDKWWQGEHFPLPKIAKGYEIVHVPTWGLRIQKVTPENKGKKTL